MNLWSYTTEYFNTKHCHSLHKNFIYPVLNNTTPTHKNGFLEDSYNTYIHGEPLGLHSHSLKCSTTVCDFLIILTWTFRSHKMHSYNISPTCTRNGYRHRVTYNETVWNKLDYRVDVCRITKGAHIEHL